MKNYITIDGGTTNTRVSLVCDNKIVDTVKLSIGARNGIDDKCALKSGIKQAISELKVKNGLSDSDIIRILASGMITCEFGLYEVEHIHTPAGINELHENMREVLLDDISDISFVFISGVKSGGKDCMLCDTDMMRGEETELVGIMTSENIKSDCIFVLPGSHSKIIETDEMGRIVNFSTMLTGEMIAALSGNTILKDAVDLSCSEIDDTYLSMGFSYCINRGINEALFKTRVLKNTYNVNNIGLYSFFLGSVLYSEISSIIKMSANTVVIGGKKQIRQAMIKLLRSETEKNVIELSDETVNRSTSVGMISIYEA